MSFFSNWNGNIVADDEIYISPNNRSFKYGDGCFETIKVINGKILLFELHFQRLLSSLQILQFSIPSFFSAIYLMQAIDQLIKLNNHHQLARVRLVVYRGNGGLYDIEDKTAYFIIQSLPANIDSNGFNDTGFTANIYTLARKTTDLYSSIKSNNYLGYAMAAMSAKENGLNDCLLTNSFYRIADSTIANVFTVAGGIIKTPALTEGCVNGVMRKYLLNCFKNESIPFIETTISKKELLNSSEVFLTNSMYGIRWLRQVETTIYSNTTSSLLHKKFIAPLFDTTTI